MDGSKYSFWILKTPSGVFEGLVAKVSADCVHGPHDVVLGLTFNKIVLYTPCAQDLHPSFAQHLQCVAHVVKQSDAIATNADWFLNRSGFCYATMDRPFMKAYQNLFRSGALEIVGKYTDLWFVNRVLKSSRSRDDDLDMLAQAVMMHRFDQLRWY